ncbi:hypothetical protein MKX01_012436 [Papaver californicum]|nr:hypothetical protein MKX01_012436 [Papaver californicum]
MGDRKATLVTNARKELEKLYLGIPDESVNLTFQDLVNSCASGNKGSSIAKSASFAFTKGLQDLKSYRDHRIIEDIKYNTSPRDHHRHGGTDHRHQGNPFYNHTIQDISTTRNNEMRSLESSFIYDDGNVCARSTFAEKCGRKRAGNLTPIIAPFIAHISIYFEACGRVYYRQCKNIGMGDMTKGRKCVECLGRRFSQRYIQKVGEIKCCAGYSNTRGNRDHYQRGHGGKGEEHDHSSNSMMMSAAATSRSPPNPVRPAYVSSSPPSFFMGSPFSDSYTPTHHHISF